MARNLIRLPIVKARTGLSKSTIYARVKEELFPKPVPLGNSLSAWIEDEIDAWVEARISARDAMPPASTTSAQASA